MIILEENFKWGFCIWTLHLLFQKW